MGISNGGMLAYLLACKLSDRIAAIADLSGAMNINNCTPQEPVSVLIFHGTDDPVIRYNGGEPLENSDWHKRIDNPTSFAVSFWKNQNRCLPTSNKIIKGNIIQETYSGCANNTEVTLYTITGGGHDTPNIINGRSTTDIIWDFFNTHPKYKS